MGCVLSRDSLVERKADEEDDDCERGTTKLATKANGDIEPKSHNPLALLAMSHNEINQTTTATATATSTDLGRPSGPSERPVRTEIMSQILPASIIWKRKRSETHQRNNKQSKKTTETRHHHNLGAFLALIIHGRRLSSSRIEAARELNEPFQGLEGTKTTSSESTSARFDRVLKQTESGDENSEPTALEMDSKHQINAVTDQPVPSIVVKQLGLSEMKFDVAKTRAQQPFPEANSDEAILFTSLAQLCYEIIGRRLVRSELNRHTQPDVMCLFVFGRQGSSKGELSFELVEHSPLVHLIGRCGEEDESSSQLQVGADQDCPLYHYIDVSALIVANLEERIREYHRLVGQALRVRREQLVLKGKIDGADSLTAESDGRQSMEDTRNSSQEVDEEEADQDKEGQLTRESSIASEVSASPMVPSDATQDGTSDGHNKPTDNHLSDQFGLVTLSTKQRSILQLRLIKYATCVTAKWVTLLIQKEVDRLETRLAPLLARPKSAKPRRVYLVNLVPNQLSLFKSCLYLQQDLPLSTFRHSYWAIKFERRTNIRLMTKEGGTGQAGADSTAGQSTKETSSSGQHANGHAAHLIPMQLRRFPQLKLSEILTNCSHHTNSSALPSRSNEQQPSDSSARDNGASQEQQQLSQGATSLLASSLNEKLGPKFSENFAQQFKSLRKLTLLRYNPTTNYNYANQASTNQQELCQAEEELKGEPSSQDVEAEAQAAKITCCARLSQDRYMAGLGDHLAPANSPSLSVASSQAASNYLASPTTSGHLEAPPSPSPSSVHSSDSPNEHQPTHSNPSRLFLGASYTNSNHSGGPIKWAVELELIDAHNNAHKWYSRPLDLNLSSDIGELNASLHQTMTSQPSNCCLYIFRQPASVSNSRSHSHSSQRSRSPLSFNQRAIGSNQVASATHCLCDHYHLVATRVAYANGRSRPVLEAKRIHRRIMKYSGRGTEATKLAELISKAQRWVNEDLDGWLRVALLGAQAPEVNVQEKSHKAGLVLSHNSTPLLVTYTIRVDVAKALSSMARKSSQEHDSSHHQVPRLTFSSTSANERNSLTPDDLAHLLKLQPGRPALSKRPASAAIEMGSRPLQGYHLASVTGGGSRLSLQPMDVACRPQSDESGRQSSSVSPTSNSKRHVQFKLTQAPSSELQENHQEDATQRAQQRLWLQESLFVSCDGAKLHSLARTFVDDLLRSLQVGSSQ